MVVLDRDVRKRLQRLSVLQRAYSWASQIRASVVQRTQRLDHSVRIAVAIVDQHAGRK